MNPYNWIYFLIGGSAAGILVRSFFETTFLLLTGICTFAVLVVAIYFFLRRPEIFFAALFLIGVSLGMLRMDVAKQSQVHPLLSLHGGEKVTIEGVVSLEPDRREGRTLLRVDLHLLNREEVEGRALLTVDPFLDLKYGDRIAATGVLREPENFETDSGNVFNYIEYLAKDDIRYRMIYPEVQLVASGEGSKLLSFLFALKQKFLNSLSFALPEPHVSLLGGLLLGAKQSLGAELLNDFRTSGLIHIVVLSGYNLTLIADAVMRSTRKFVPRAGTWIASVLLLLFVLAVGPSATVIRASIMAFLVLIAHSSGRVYDVTRALVVTAFLMLMHNPYLLAYDPSFQLSFLATLGLVQLAPRLESFIPWVTDNFNVRRIIAATVGTQIVVLPLLLYQTGYVSLVSLFANLLVLPTVPLTMLLGSLSGTLHFVSSFAALPFTALVYFLLEYQLWVATSFAHLPGSTLALSGFPSWAVLLSYASMVLLLVLLIKRGYLPLPLHAKIRTA